MGRSFYRLTPATLVEDLSNARYYHEASDRHYEVVARGGEYFQRRFQLKDGKQVRVVEKRIDYVMGSGNHARTYLHQTPRGTLQQMPLGWYSENSGTWAMSPGYDRPYHEGFRREINYECMACHNSVPKVPEGARNDGSVYVGELPEGISCQRCHGPADTHVRLARRSDDERAIRASVLNPKSLSPQRQTDVCLRCHLQSMAEELPYALLLEGETPFSFAPGESLGSYMLHFEPADGAALKSFEIDHAGYRMLKSACYRGSAGAMTCTTCHDPHHARRGEQAAAEYRAACLGCHGQTLTPDHASQQGCVACHMPKRRTHDVVHTVMTDHLIPRLQATGDPLAPRAEKPGTERYSGEVTQLYPPGAPAESSQRLAYALAQVVEDSNTERGVDLLAAALKAQPGAPAEAYVALAKAYRRLGASEAATGALAAALDLAPGNSIALATAGAGKLETGLIDEAVDDLRLAVERDPQDTKAAGDLATAHLLAGQAKEARDIAEDVLEENPEIPVAWNTLGLARQVLGERIEAEAAFQEALRLQPDYAEAWGNLAVLLASENRRLDAESAFRRGIELGRPNAGLHNSFGLFAAQIGRGAEAKQQFLRAIEIDPENIEARLNLAEQLYRLGESEGCLVQAEAALALDSDSGRSHLLRGYALAALGELDSARESLKRAQTSGPDVIRGDATLALRRLSP